MVKEPGKAKKMKAPAFHAPSKTFNRKKFHKVEQRAAPTPSIFHHNPVSNAQLLQDSDKILVNCVKNVLKMLKVESYMEAMEQLNPIYTYVMASISFGEYAAVQSCSVDEL